MNNLNLIGNGNTRTECLRIEKKKNEWTSSKSKDMIETNSSLLGYIANRTHAANSRNKLKTFRTQNVTT
jgi:hypothetical protein